MQKFQIYVEEEIDERIDVYLSKQLNEFSRSYIQKIIKENLVKVNDQHVKPRYLVKKGDNILIELPKPKKLKVVPQNIYINIVYEDNDLAIVNKPQGMVVHPATGNYSNTLVNALLYHMDSLSSLNGDIRPGIVHRIDKDTSGLLIIAKNNFAHQKISDDLKIHCVTRKYIALVYGNIKKDNGTIDTLIGRHPVNRKKMAVVQKNGKRAITHFNVIERFGDYTLIQAFLETGRTHQIRVHMSYIKHPVVGDPVYSNSKNKFGLKGQLLHAKIIGFNHPRTEKYVEFNSQLPDYFKKVLNILRKNVRC